ncbi:MAG: polyphosphate polymerase domain-containing protein [Culicoidibacterales bacterium]
MNPKTTFKRYELKYFITKSQKEALLELFKNRMRPDEFGKNSIFNIYYDTPDFLIIRRSIEKPAVYKEKLRLRSYGRADDDTEVFLELKKKYEAVVYKRRLSLSAKEASQYFTGTYLLPETQIAKEINYFKTLYTGIAPRVFIAYDREAFFAIDDSEGRITFDENIVWRDEELSLNSQKYGNRLIHEDMALMEVKVAGGIPLWLTQFLTAHNIYKTSFSKYGNTYKAIRTRK